MDNIDIIDKKTSKLSQNQTFVIAMLSLVMFMAYSSYNRYSERIDTRAHQKVAIDKSDEIISLLTLISDGKTDILSLEAAKDKYHDKFQCSAYRILDMTMHTLTVNNVHDSIRQLQISSYYETAITNMYMDDKQSLAKFRYGNKRLNGVMMDINPHEIIKPVLTIMFSNRPTLQKRKDLRQFLYGSFERFYQKGVTYLQTNKTPQK